MSEYIFGYGSLIERESRLRTIPSANESYPIEVEGLKRGWFARTEVSGLSTTFLGCIEQDDYTTNGVVYEVTKKERIATDKREIGYTRIKINPKNIKVLTDKIYFEPEDKIWVYVNKFVKNIIPKSNLPNDNFPIVQSYVDICINGCLEIEKEFPQEKEGGYSFVARFIDTTYYWNSFWENDRIYPRRPFIYQKNAYKIDGLLKAYLPDKFLSDNAYNGLVVKGLY